MWHLFCSWGRDSIASLCKAFNPINSVCCDGNEALAKLAFFICRGQVAGKTKVHMPFPTIGFARVCRTQIPLLYPPLSLVVCDQRNQTMKISSSRKKKPDLHHLILEARGSLVILTERGLLPFRFSARHENPAPMESEISRALTKQSRCRRRMANWVISTRCSSLKDWANKEERKWTTSDR